MSITRSVTEFFNLSISTGVFPSEWKTGRIVPIPKGNNQSLPSGFRPISILPIVRKLFEWHVKSIIEKHLLENAPISPLQWETWTLDLDWDWTVDWTGLWTGLWTGRVTTITDYAHVVPCNTQKVLKWMTRGKGEETFMLKGKAVNIIIVAILIM